jgi:glycine/D-amino acid oxidase-like deaminating enzyme
MAVDTPAKIAIVGAGPVGLEAALYARYLGYEVDLYERGRAAEHLRRWAHVTPFTPWGMNTTSLATAALTAQNERWTPAAPEAYLTYGELVERYFQPLADCDLLADCLQPQTEVVAIGREGLLRSDWFDDERRIDVPFRLLVRDAEGRERIEFAEVVLDCSCSIARA